MKGSVFDAFTIGVIMFAFGVIVLVGGTILQGVEDAVVNQTIRQTMANGQVQNIQLLNQTFLDSGQAAFNQFDTLMTFILIGLIATSVVLAFLIPTHPVMIVPSIFVLLISVIVAAQLTNAYNTIATQSSLVAQANNMPITAQIMSNLPFIVLAIGAIIMIAMFVTIRRGSGGIAG